MTKITSKFIAVGLQICLLFSALTAQSTVFESTRLHDLRANPMAGLLISPSFFGKADLVVFKKAVVIPANQKNKSTVVRISPVCELTTDSSDKTRLIEENSVFGLVEAQQLEEKTSLSKYQRKNFQLKVSNSRHFNKGIANATVICRGVNANTSVSELTHLAGQIIVIQ